MTTQFIQGSWVAGEGDLLSKTNPATAEPIWQGKTASAEQVSRAVAAARAGDGGKQFLRNQQGATDRTDQTWYLGEVSIVMKF